MKEIFIKRIYDEPSYNDGYRVLVDRLWPRGVSKEKAKLDEWAKELAPSTELRKWFDHKEKRFDEFAKRYQQELIVKGPELDKLRSISEKEHLTLLYGAKDKQLNQAVVLRDVLLK